MWRCSLAIILLLQSFAGYGQQYVYVTTPNLILKSNPEEQYFVFAIMQPGCQLQFRPGGLEYYKDKPALTDKFLPVCICYKEENGFYTAIYGWVEKKYVSESAEGSLPIGTGYTKVNIGDMEDPEVCNNAADYPYPKYKGGARTFKKHGKAGKGKLVFHTGARGGCYYINAHGRKVYVDSRMCK